MNKIEEYFNSLKPKEFIYLLVSIPIIIFVVYYNFIYPTINKEIINLHKQEKSKKKELISVSSKIRHLKSIAHTLKPTEKKLENLKEDYKYIKYNLYTLKSIKLDNSKIYMILSNLLNKANILKLNVSFNIKWNQEFPPFSEVISLEIDGSGDYINILKYLQYIENMKAINYVKDIQIFVNKDENKLIQNFVSTKKFNNNSLSFVLQKYSNKDLEMLKSFSNNSLKISISVYENNPNYLLITYKGDKNSIENLAKTLKQLKNNKQLFFTGLNMKINSVKPNNVHKIKTQQFKINLIIMGIK